MHGCPGGGEFACNLSQRLTRHNGLFPGFCAMVKVSRACARSTAFTKPGSLIMPARTKLWIKAFRVITVTMLLAGSCLVRHAALAEQAATKRTDLQRHDLSIPGHEVVQARVDFAEGATFGRHTHPGEEIIYVLEGTIEYQLDGKPPVTLKAGGVLFGPAGTVHAARNVGSGNAAELGTYVVEKGKPLLTLVQ
jgi:quercetin dioxygenase-like cupin family protein